MKKCKSCEKVKSLTDFYFLRIGRTGMPIFNPECKECTRKRSAANLKFRKETEILRKRFWRTEHGDIVRRVRREWYRRNPEAQAAYGKVIRALEKGLLIKPEFCQRCGKKRELHAHHEDYSKPLEVEWLCRECHAQTQTKKLRGFAVRSIET